MAALCAMHGKHLGTSVLPYPSGNIMFTDHLVNTDAAHVDRLHSPALSSPFFTPAVTFPHFIYRHFSTIVDIFMLFGKLSLANWISIKASKDSNAHRQTRGIAVQFWKPVAWTPNTEVHLETVQKDVRVYNIDKKNFQNHKEHIRSLKTLRYRLLSRKKRFIFPSK